MYIKSLKLTQFRSYEFLDLKLEKSPVVITGPNGYGKTNLLEAISLLCPGRGMRNASQSELANQKSDKPIWACSAEMVSDYGQVVLGTGYNPKGNTRLVKIDGQVVRAQTNLAEYSTMVWLTPQMDHLFLEAASFRRRFLDRLVFSFDPAHIGRITRYENAVRQRLDLLTDPEKKDQDVWVSGLETIIAETGVSISAARKYFLEKLGAASRHDLENKFFPNVRYEITGFVEDMLENGSALDTEEKFLEKLKLSRSLDGEKGVQNYGAHRTDFMAWYIDKNIPARDASTGEQKTLLIAIVLAHARLLKAEKGVTPIMLLDEVGAHLDEKRREGLYHLLHDVGGQYWMTGTEENLFENMADKAQFFDVRKLQKN